MNKKRSIVDLSNKAILITSKTLKSEKGIKTPTEVRKSVRKPNMRRTEDIGITPTPNSINALPFLLLFGLFDSIKKYLRANSVNTRFNGDLFIMLLIVVGSGKVGCTITKGSLLYNSCKLSSDSRNRMVCYRFTVLVNCGLLTVRSVKGINRYFISIDAENLIKKSVSVKDMRELNKMVKDVL